MSALEPTIEYLRFYVDQLNDVCDALRSELEAQTTRATSAEAALARTEQLLTDLREQTVAA